MSQHEDSLKSDWHALTASSAPGVNLVAATVSRMLVGKVWLSADGARVVWSAPTSKAQAASKLRLDRSGQLVRDGEVLRERAVLGSPSQSRLAHQAVSVTDIALLERFARLHLASSDDQPREIQAMVQEYGPLGLCGHGKPKGHMPRRMAVEILDELDRWQDAQDHAASERDMAMWERRAAEARSAGKRPPRKPMLRTTTPDARPWHHWQPCSIDRSFKVPEFKPRTKIAAIGAERIEDWDTLSRQAAALIKLGAANRRFQAAAEVLAAGNARITLPLGMPDLEEIEALDPLLPPGVSLDFLVPWTQATDNAGRRRLPNPDLRSPGPFPDGDKEAIARYEETVKVADAERLPPGSTPWGPRQIAQVAHDLQRVLNTALQTWLDQGDLRVQTILDPPSGLIRLRWGNDGLFSALAIIMAMTVGGINALAICDYCRQAHRPTKWPTVGDHLYCPDCRERPDYAKIRKRMSRLTRPVAEAQPPP